MPPLFPPPHQGSGSPVAARNTLGHALTLASKPGRGSVFKLALPTTATKAVQVGMSPQAETGRLRGLHVLVIDDDEAVLRGMAQLLQSWGCMVDTAESISQALPLANMQTPDVLISDYRLRGQRTGGQAINEICDLLDRDIPALMITSDTAPERLREALSSGAPLLHKPVAPDQLYGALVGLVGARVA